MELTALAGRFPTHLGEPKTSVLVQRAVAELRGRRAADLSAEEREALAWARDRVESIIDIYRPGYRNDMGALAVLDRLLASEERR
jgi:hypothetical protein